MRILQYLKIETAALYFLILSLPFYIVRFRIGGVLPTTLVEVSFFCYFLLSCIALTRAKKWSMLFESIRTSKFLFPIGLFLVASVISLFSAPDTLKAVGLWRAFIGEPLLVFVLIHQHTREERTAIVKTFFLSGLLVALYGLQQFVTGTNEIAPLEAAQGRITSFFNHPNYLSLYIGPIIFITLYLVGEGRNKYFYISSLLLMSVILLTTQSLGGYIALGAGYVFLALLYYYGRVGLGLQNLIRILVLSSVVGGIVVLGVLFLNISTFTPKNGLVWPRPDPSTTTIRLCVWEGTKALLAHSPFLGAGIGGFYISYPTYRTCDTEYFVYPHNIILNFWVEMGLLGVLSFLWILFVFFAEVFKNPSRLSIILGTVMVFWLVQGLVDVPYFKNDLSMFFWIVVGVVSLQKGKIPNLSPQ